MNTTATDRILSWLKIRSETKKPPTTAAASDAIEEFEELMHRFRAARGDDAADSLLAKLDEAQLIPRCA